MLTMHRPQLTVVGVELLVDVDKDTLRIPETLSIADIVQFAKVYTGSVAE